MRNPTNCKLWKEPEAAFAAPMKDLFALLDTLVQESHWWRYVLHCRECGQKYFFEFYEEIDWDQGKDPQYSTYIPVESDEQVQSLAGKSHFELLAVRPRLNKDFPSDAESPRVYWLKGD